MTTNHNLHSEQESLLATLEHLAHKGAIRQLDYQFARFLFLNVMILNVLIAKAN